MSTTSVQNKQPPAPNASNQNNQFTQTGVKKFSSSKRTPTRHSAAKDLSLLHHSPKTGSKKLVETWRHKGTSTVTTAKLSMFNVEAEALLLWHIYLTPMEKAIDCVNLWPNRLPKRCRAFSSANCTSLSNKKERRGFGKSSIGSVLACGQNY